MPASATLQHDLDAPYALKPEQITRFREDGFIKLKNVFTKDVLDYYGDAVTRFTMAKNRLADVPMEKRSTYDKAFIQVSNIWETDDVVKEFSFSKRIARIAAELMGCTGTRMWHDQALYKEPAGGFTPWHADQQYWPLSSAKSVTAWIPLQAVPIEMGPLCFAKGSHLKAIGRDLEISDESEQRIRDELKQNGLMEVQEPFELGEVSFHYGWTLHRAGPNVTQTPRKVHTVIYIDEDIRLVQPKNENQAADWRRWTPSTKLGEIIADPLNPVLWSSRN